jgi:hypothetical protein
VRSGSDSTSSLPAAFRPDPDVVAQRMGDDVVLVHLRSNRIYELNRTGARCWELLVAGYDRAGILAGMLREFDVSEPLLDVELDGLLALLLTEGLVQAETSA